MAVAGVCHSDDHYATGDGVMSPELAAIMEATGGSVPEYFPLLGGHEGAGRRRRGRPRCAVGTAR